MTAFDGGRYLDMQVERRPRRLARARAQRMAMRVTIVVCYAAIALEIIAMLVARMVQP